MGAGESDHFFSFPTAAEEFLVFFSDAAEDRLHHRHAERLDEFGEFLEQGFCLGRLTGIRVKSHQQGALDHFWFLSDFEHPQEAVALGRAFRYGNFGGIG
jgi:hypothetical protein